MNDPSPIEEISNELMRLLGTDEQVEPFTRRGLPFDLSAAYAVVARVAEMRRAQGHTPVGRKIGFTNRAIWGHLGIAAPIWNYVFDSTVRATVGGEAQQKLSGMPEPKIEPEFVLHLASAPRSGMTDHELVACLDWVAPGFEVVYSIFPNWDFTATDAAAAYGVHGALFIGERLSLRSSLSDRLDVVSNFSVELESSGGTLRNGHARNVLGGPIEALRFLVDELAGHPNSEPLRAGEIVTTGTLTEAMPALAGDAWTAQFSEIGFASLRLRFN